MMVLFMPRFRVGKQLLQADKKINFSADYEDLRRNKSTKISAICGSINSADNYAEC
jgi:hypothetical protein